MAPFPTILLEAGFFLYPIPTSQRSPGHVSVEIGNQLIFFMAQAAAVVGDARP